MKAKSVFENIEFERGKEPKEAMGVGRDAMMDQRIQKLKDEYNIQFPFESDQPHWKDHRANAARILQGAYNDDQLDLFVYVLDYMLEHFPEIDRSVYGNILGNSALNGMPEYIIELMERGIQGEDIPREDNDEVKESVIDMLWVLLKERLKNEG